MEALPDYPDNHFDLAIVDPPYGIEYDKIQNKCAGKYRTQNGGTWKKYHETDWDSNIPDKIYFKQLIRVSKQQTIWGGNYYELPGTSCFLIWDKIQRDNRSDCEIAWTNFRKPSKIFSYSRADAYINHCDNKIHPTQKPVALYKWLLKNYAEPGWSILDTHLGSGSIAIACYYMGFDLTGYEIDTEYYENMVQRIEEQTAQESLF
jgi:site-specific DNA-methyltransferase (adenine-specific)